MLSKSPIEFPKDRKFTKAELAEALRYSIIAELDAVNLYLQFARFVEDERYRKVFEDIAKEEKTHIGEFLALLKTIDSEQVSELAAGREEVKEITGMESIPDPPSEGGKEVSAEPLTSGEWEYLNSKFKETLDSVRKIRRYLPVYKAGRGVEAVILEGVSVKEVVEPTKPLLIPLVELDVKFSIRQRTLDYARKEGVLPDISSALYAATQLGFNEDTLLLKGGKEGVRGLLNIEGVLEGVITDWEEPGSAVNEISKTISAFTSHNIPPPYILFISPIRYTKLLTVRERTGVMELTRLKALVKDVVQLQQLPDNIALMVSANPYMIDIVIGTDTVIDYIGPEDDKHVFRAWETIALRVKQPKAIAILKQQ